MRRFFTLTLLIVCTAAAQAAPIKVGVIGLVHGHIDGFLNQSNLTPAGGILHRPDVELVGIVEPDQRLFDTYAAKAHPPPRSSSPRPTSIAASSKSAPHRKFMC